MQLTLLLFGGAYVQTLPRWVCENNFIFGEGPFFFIVAKFFFFFLLAP